MNAAMIIDADDMSCASHSQLYTPHSMVDTEMRSTYSLQIDADRHDLRIYLSDAADAAANE